MSCREENIISIIIPIYNAEKYINRCLNSITQQTYKEIEIICINDGSDDNSLFLLNLFKKKDNRIKVLSIDNKGVSFARNYGLKNAKGNYIMFVDADDWISPNTCEIAISKMKEKNVDLIIWPYIREYKTRSMIKNIFETDIEFEKKDVMKLHRKLFGLLENEMTIPTNSDALCTVWGKLYKKNIINQNKIQFSAIDQIGSFEDGLFNIDYFYRIDKIYYINQYLYHYWKENKDSITSKFNEKLIHQKKNLYLILENKIRENKLSDIYKEALNNRKCLDYLSLGINATSDDSSFKIQVNRLKEILKDSDRKKNIRNFNISYMPFQWKCFYFLLKINSLLGYYFLLKVIKKLRK